MKADLMYIDTKSVKRWQFVTLTNTLYEISMKRNWDVTVKLYFDNIVCAGC